MEERGWQGRRSFRNLARIVVPRDPAVSTGEDADETGIIVAGKDANGHGYVLADQSGRYPPTEWARTAIALHRQHKADRIVAEVNNGGAAPQSGFPLRKRSLRRHDPIATRLIAPLLPLIRGLAARQDRPSL